MSWLRKDTWADALSPNPVKIELYYSAAWHDITDDVNELDGIRVVRGQPNEGSSPEATTMELTLKDLTGKYSPRNPDSVLYGLIGRNTPIRFSAYLGGAWSQRFQGEVTAWPQAWTLKGENFSRIQCSGVTRRLDQGAKPLRSTLYYGIMATTSVRGYWPLEDAPGSTLLESALGGRPGRVTGSPTFADYDGLVSSAPMMRPGTAKLALSLNPYASTGVLQCRFVANIPAATPNGAVIARMWASSTLGWVDLIYGTGGALTAQAYTRYGVAMTAVGPVGFGVDGLNLMIEFRALQVAGNVTVSIGTINADTGEAFQSSVSVGTATVGYCTSIEINPGRVDLGDLAIGHVQMDDVETGLDDQYDALRAYLGERAAARITRMAAILGITLSLQGDDGASTPLGPQKRMDPLSIMREAAEADTGMLFEARSALALIYRPPAWLYGRTMATATVPYEDNLLLPFDPVDDDQNTRNLVTVTRDGGGSATYEDTESTLSTQAPPDGVGTYEADLTLSLRVDEQALHQASHRVHHGTVDEPRYPRIGVDLAHPAIKANTALRTALLALTLLDRLDVTDLPDWLPPDDVQGVVLGYTEEVTAEHYKITYNCSPYRPWRGARYADTGIADRWTNSTTTINGAHSSTTPSLSIKFTAGPRWDHGDGDFDIVVAKPGATVGERMTVTAVAGTSSPQTFTVVRSVNGVVRALADGDTVSLADQPYYGI